MTHRLLSAVRAEIRYSTWMLAKELSAKRTKCSVDACFVEVALFLVVFVVFILYWHVFVRNFAVNVYTEMDSIVIMSCCARRNYRVLV